MFLKRSQIKKLAILFLGALFLIFQLSQNPAYSLLDTVSNACARQPNPQGCLAELGAVKEAVGNAGAANPIGTGATLGAVNPWAVAGGAAALWYLTDQSMANLRNFVSSNAPMIYPVYSSIVFTSSMTGPGWSCRLPCFVVKGGLAVQYTDGSYASLPDASYYRDTFSIIPFNGMNPTKQSLVDAAKNLSSAAILAEAASAAADFAKSSTDSASTIAAADATAAANEWVKNDPSATSSDTAKAQAAADTADAASSSQTDGCTKQEKYELQQEVSRLCKGAESGRSCTAPKNLPMTREEAGKNAAKFEACAVARDTINNKCFGGGDKEHQNAANESRNGAKSCRQLEQSLPF